MVSNLTAERGLDLGVWEDGLIDTYNNTYYKKEVYAYAWKAVPESKAYKLANAGYKVIFRS